jgi:hypothetical protein
VPITAIAAKKAPPGAGLGCRRRPQHGTGRCLMQVGGEQLEREKAAQPTNHGKRRPTPDE